MGLGYHQFLKYIYIYFHLRMILSPYLDCVKSPERKWMLYYYWMDLMPKKGIHINFPRN